MTLQDHSDEYRAGWDAAWAERDRRAVSQPSYDNGFAEGVVETLEMMLKWLEKRSKKIKNQKAMIAETKRRITKMRMSDNWSDDV